MSSIFNVFSTSPFGILSEHMQEVVSAVTYLEAFFGDLMLEDWDKVREHQQAIVAQESVADEIKKRLYLSLQSDLFMPVSRYDILALVRSQDAIANQAKDIAGIAYGRRLLFPKPVHASLKAYLQSALEACAQAHHIVKELEHLLKGNFTAEKVALVEKMVTEIDAAENKNDKIQVALRAEILQLESELSPVDAIFMYKILDRIGMLADHSHHVGAKFLLFLPAKN